MASFYRSLLFTLAICAIMLLVISGQPWVSALITDSDIPNFEYNFSGRQLEPIIGGLIVVPATAVVGLIAAKGFISRLVGLATSAVGFLIAYLTFSVNQNLASYTQNLIANKLGRNVTQIEIDPTVFSYAVVAPAIGVGIVGLIFTFKNFDSAKKQARYDQDIAAGITLTPWQAMDSGIDPTISVMDGSAEGASGNSSS